jgi:hypothetical protein
LAEFTRDEMMRLAERAGTDVILTFTPVSDQSMMYPSVLNVETMKLELG